MTRENQSRAILARLALGGLWMGAALLAAMAFLVVLQVAARNFADMGLPWADELARFCVIGLVFIGVPALAGRGALVSVTLLPEMLGETGQRTLRLFGDLATLTFCGLLLWGFAEFLPRAGKFLTPAMRVPNYVYYSLALLGSCFLCLVVLHRLWTETQGRDPSGSYALDDTDETTGLIE